ncbi:MAG: sulfotransferase [Alphaproteobacteria bacterium]|nr:MAG: sulfotransferase [Alphaproteobacteria bacterium]
MENLFQELLAKARVRTGLSDFGDDDFVGPLTAWIEDLSETHLSERGRKFLTNLAVTDLSRRLQVIDCLKQNPEIEEIPIPPILYITGLERSGTTLLHNLLSLHTKARFLSRWQLMMPTPPPEAETMATDTRAQLMQKSIDALRGTDLEKMHWVDAVDPEECVWGFINCSGLLGQAPGPIMPRWMDWMANADWTDTFSGYRKVIQILTYKNPVPENGFLVLKAPQISRHLQSFADAFPEAHFVFTHRDPYRAITSTCALVEIVDRPFLEDPNYFRANKPIVQTFFDAGADRLNDIAAFAKRSPERSTNIRYEDLVSHPIDVTTKVIDEAGFESDPQLETSISDFLEQQRSGRRASPKKDIHTFGYTPEMVHQNPSFKAYMEYFKVTPEITRQTGT